MENASESNQNKYHWCRQHEIDLTWLQSPPHHIFDCYKVKVTILIVFLAGELLANGEMKMSNAR